MPNIVTLTPSTICSVPIPIGERGENVCSAVRFDFTEWADEYGEGAVSLLVKRKGDTSAYPVVVPVSEHVATWTISNTDTAVHGYGKAEFVFTLGDLIAKTAVFSIYVANDIGPNGEPPEPIQEWMDELVALGAETLINAQAAQTAQEAAETAQASAETAAENAESSAAAAAQSAGAARDMAASALSSADRATASATAASGHATAAETAKDLAISAAEDAQHSETQAELSASAAAESAESASGSATTATTAATNASASATQSANNLAEAIEAAEDAEAAEEAATAAAQSASNAATNAAASATSASGSASAAATSAEQAAESAEKADIDLLKLLPTDTASGSIASFSDGADNVPVEALTVALEPIQDLHGQSSPYPAGGGKNKCGLFESGSWKESAPVGAEYADMLFANDARARSKELIPVTYPMTISIASGYQFALVVFDENKQYLGANSFLSFRSSAYTRSTAWYGDGKYIAIAIKNDSGTNLTASDFENFHIQIELGSTATTYAPYSNICPITGHTQAQVWRSGVNVWDEEWENGSINFSTGAKQSSSANIRSKNYISVVGGETYYGKAGTLSSSACVVFFYTEDKTYISNAYCGNTTFTAPSNAKYALFYCGSAYGTTYNNDISINYPSTDHDYHAHSIANISIPLGQTVYGGVVDVTSGVLTVECVKRTLASFNGAWGVTGSGYYGVFTSISTCERDPYNKSGYFKCNRFAFSKLGYDQMPLYSFCGGSGVLTTLSFILPSTITSLAEANAWLADNPTEFTYKLATPITIDLTAHELTTLYGQNNVWSDSGDVDITYRADIQLYIQKMIAEALA